MIAKIDKKVSDWNQDEVKQQFMQQADAFFHNEIRNKDIKVSAKEWHRNI